ncbi:MAG: AraC family transcriptional regulator [Oscillospiraceae bacterium]
MKRQNDWFTGIEYYGSYNETCIEVERKTISHEYNSAFHQQAEMLYILSGSGCITINGCDYPAKEGGFFCLYSHHFYNIHSVTEKLEVIVVKFYIGLFMYMSWEKHPKNANAKLMYDTKPMVTLSQTEKKKVEELFKELLLERKEARFSSLNMMIYKTLELHAYFCRYAFEAIGEGGEDEHQVWAVIKKALLASGEKIPLKELAQDLHCSQRVLNERIKQTCGYTFFQLQQMAKLINATALLHFPDLTMNYISDLTGFSCVTGFYRAFSRQYNMTPREYQQKCIETDNEAPHNSSLAMNILQYIHLNFMHEFTLEELSRDLYTTPYGVERVMEEAFGMNFKELVGEIRVSYGAAMLKTGRCSAIDTATLCGFDSYSTFSRAFREYMNQTPSQFMKT